MSRHVRPYALGQRDDREEHLLVRVSWLRGSRSESAASAPSRTDRHDDDRRPSEARARAPDDRGCAGCARARGCRRDAPSDPAREPGSTPGNRTHRHRRSVFDRPRAQRRGAPPPTASSPSRRPHRHPHGAASRRAAAASRLATSPRDRAFRSDNRASAAACSASVQRTAVAYAQASQVTLAPLMTMASALARTAVSIADANVPNRGCWSLQAIGDRAPLARAGRAPTSRPDPGPGRLAEHEAGRDDDGDRSAARSMTGRGTGPDRRAARWPSADPLAAGRGRPPGAQSRPSEQRGRARDHRPRAGGRAIRGGASSWHDARDAVGDADRRGGASQGGQRGDDDPAGAERVRASSYRSPPACPGSARRRRPGRARRSRSRRPDEKHRRIPTASHT